MNLNGIHFRLSMMTNEQSSDKNQWKFYSNQVVNGSDKTYILQCGQQCSQVSFFSIWPSLDFRIKEFSQSLYQKKKHSMQKRLFGNKSFFLLPDDQQSYMFLCLLPLSQHVPHVLFSKGFSLKVDNDENYQRLQNTEQVEETTVHWSIPLAQLCVDASPILLYVSELTQPQLL